MFAARLCMIPFGVKVKVQGREKFPASVGPVIIVCNHQSQLDTNICSTGLSDVNFKCTYKRELLYYPGIGSALWLAGHVSVKRGDRDSGHQMMEACANYLRKGVSILFFAEGTRLASGTEPVGEFKAGAFKLSMDTGIPILPVSISGARDLFPAKGFPRMGYGDPVLTVHAPIYPPSNDAVKTMDKETFNGHVNRLLTETRNLILKDMRPCDNVPAPTTPVVSNDKTKNI
jgi:1-acyl-sn-glycerol-3-phosphate acyltransferase